EKEDGASIGEMPVHPVKFDVVDNIRLVHLVFHGGTGTPFHEHVAAELTGQDDQRAVQMARLVQILDQLRHGGINQLFHAHHAGMTDFMGVPAHKGDRKSTRLNSSHVNISYAVVCW